MSAKAPVVDYVDRSKRAQKNRAGDAVFTILRSLDPVIQYLTLSGIVGRPLVRALGGTFVEQGPVVPTGFTYVDKLGLSPYRLALLGMYATSAGTQLLWNYTIRTEWMPPLHGLEIAGFNGFINVVNAIMFVNKVTSAVTTWGGDSASNYLTTLPMIIGLVFFTIGIITERTAEFQRTAFKKRADSKGKCFTEGLFSVVRHPNFAGYTMWRFGSSLASGGWVWGFFVGGWFAQDFYNRGIPALDKYCTDRYGEGWQKYKRNVTSVLYPGIL